MIVFYDYSSFKMSLPVIVIATSRNCGHCRNMRGEDGYLLPKGAPPRIKGNGNAGWAWNEDFFKKLIRGGANEGPARFRVYEIHYGALSSQFNNIEEFSEFTIDKDKVKRTVYYKRDGKIYTITTSGYNNTRPKPTIVPNVTFEALTLSTFPADVGNMFAVFPGWLYIDGTIWEQAKLRQTPLYGYSASLNIIKTDKGYGWQPISATDPRPMTRGVEDPVEIASRIVAGTLTLNAPTDKQIIPSQPKVSFASTHCEGLECKMMPMSDL